MSSAPATLSPAAAKLAHEPDAAVYDFVPIHLDPPERAKSRAPLRKAFSPTAMLALQEDIHIHTLADQLIDRVKPRGRCHFMVEVTEPPPARVFLKMRSRPPEFRLDPEHPPTFHCGHVIGVDSPHLVWNA